MSDALPIQIQMGALPPAVSWTPQQLADAMVRRMSLVTSQSFALFVAGSTEPAYNAGPWLKNGTEWWVWDNGTGQYEPISVPQESLGYFIGSTTPDQTVYQFWIQTTAGGQPLAIKTYYSGAWTDVYAQTLSGYVTAATLANYSTTAQMNSAIAAAISGIPASVVGQGLFKGVPSVNQNVVFGAGGNQSGTVNLGTIPFNPDSSFAANKFTVPATGYYTFSGSLNTGVSSGSPTSVDIRAYFAVNGSAGDSLNDEPSVTELGGRVFVGTTVLQLSAGDEVELSYDITVDAACTVYFDAAETFLTGYRVR